MLSLLSKVDDQRHPKSRVTRRLSENARFHDCFQEEVVASQVPFPKIGNHRSRNQTHTVLVVDDSPSIRYRICEICSLHDFEVCAEAVNGADAIEKAQKWQPELIILDLSMPVMNGLEAAPQLKQILPNTPIIMFTMFGDTLPQTTM